MANTMLVTDTKLIALADSIRKKSGQTGSMSLDAMESTVARLATVKNSSTWGSATIEELTFMLDLHDRGIIDIREIWQVGDERVVALPAMRGVGSFEKHAAQNVTFVLMNAGGKELEDGSECHFVVGMKNAFGTSDSVADLDEYGRMNSSSNTNRGEWEDCNRRTWCNSTFANALPADFRSLFKKHKNKTYGTVSIDLFALPSTVEVMGSASGARSSDEGAQFEYYKTASRRRKYYGNTSTQTQWFHRSPYINTSDFMCQTGINTVGHCAASDSRGISPFGCI